MVLVKHKKSGVHKPGTASELFGDREIKTINDNLTAALKRYGLWKQKRQDGLPIIPNNSAVRSGEWERRRQERKAA